MGRCPAGTPQTAWRGAAAGALDSHVVLSVGVTCQCSHFSNQLGHQTTCLDEAVVL